MAADPAAVQVRVCRAREGRVEECWVEVPEGSSVLQAARASGLVPTDWQGPLGVAGRVVEPQQRVSAGDRVEILQPLQVDPRTRRRERAAARRPRPG